MDVREFLGQTRSTLLWAHRGFGAPYPHYMKQSTLLRHAIAQSVFVETGTYRGSTSRYFARRGFKVITVEVHEPLYQRYAPGLLQAGIDARLGDSAELLPAILRECDSAAAINVFLDGHYSGGITGRGERAVPVVKEFDTLQAFILERPHLRFSIMVDDVRLFMPHGDPMYPMRSSLFEFARALGVDWKVENDIFIASNTFE